MEAHSETWESFVKWNFDSPYSWRLTLGKWKKMSQGSAFTYYHHYWCWKQLLKQHLFFLPHPPWKRKSGLESPFSRMKSGLNLILGGYSLPMEPGDWRNTVLLVQILFGPSQKHTLTGVCNASFFSNSTNANKNPSRKPSSDKETGAREVLRQVGS